MKKNKARFVAEVGVLTSLALILSFLERLIPPFVIGIPGIKLGLSNIVTLFALYRLGLEKALLIVLVRCLLTALLFGSGIGFVFSISGGLVSTFVMAACMKLSSVSAIGTSIAGAASHNITQIAVAAFIMQTAGLFAYLTMLLLLSIPLGALIGLTYLAFDRLYPYAK